MDTQYTTENRIDSSGNPYQVRIPSNITPTVSAGTIGTTPLTIPTQTPTQDLTPTIQGLAQQAQNQATADQIAVTNAEKNKDSTVNVLKNLQEQLGGQSTTQSQLETQQNIPQMTKELSDLSALGQQQTAQYLSRINAQNQGGTGTVGGVSAQEAEITRQHAIDALMTNSLIQAKQGNITYAQNLVDKAIAAKYDPIKAQIKANQDFLDANYKDLTRADQKLATAQSAKNALDLKQIEQKQQDAKDNNAIALSLAGVAPASVLKQIGEATSVNDAIQLASTYLPKTLENQLKQANIDKIKADNKKTLSEIKAAGGISGDSKYAGVINTILGSGKFTAQQAQAIKNGINQGEDPFTVIKNNAKNIMGQTEATTLTKYEAAKDSLQSLQSNLNDYYAKGGKTDIFSGNYEKVINSLGEVKDPNLVDLATQIQAQLQIYRNAVSGTAYSAQEGADINRIFPGINKTQGLNEAILKGRMSAFDSTIDSVYRTTLGTSTYDNLKKAESNGTKGALSDANFIEQALTNQGLRYTDVIAQYSKTLQPGEQLAISNSDRKIYAVTKSDITSGKYTPL